jgi:fructokinase
VSAGIVPGVPRARRVLCFGEVLWDVFAGHGGAGHTANRGPAFGHLTAGRGAAGATAVVLGGAPFNLAYRLTSLGDRGIVASRVGDDVMGKEAISRIEKMGLSTGCVQLDDLHPTGTNVITLDDRLAGSRTLPHDPHPRHDLKRDVAYDYIEATPPLLEAARSVDCVNFGTLIQRSPVSRRSLEQVLLASGGALKLLDLNLRAGCYRRETVLFSLENADILKLNEDEAGYLTERFGLPVEPLPSFCERAVKRWNLSCVTVTLGERGACVFTPQEGFFYRPGLKVNVVDGEGCGDAFTAGFLRAFMGGESVEECLALGNTLGALAASRRGATGRIDPEDIARFMGERHEPVVDERLREYPAR